MAAPGKFRFSIDRGGTFTDIYAEVPDPAKPYRVLKLLSEDPKNYSDAPREGIRRILEEVTGIPHPRDKPVPHERIESIRMGTTVATNALLERKGARMAFFVTAGFKDLLHIGNQSRPHIFDLKIEKPDNLYERVVEVQERVLLQREEEQNVFPAPGAAAPSTSPVIVTGTTGEKLVVEQAPDRETLRKQLQEVKDAGITSIAVALMHSYTYPAHEQLIAEVARELGFQQISLSSEVMPMIKIVARAYTACADAYLTPHIVRYVNSFKSGFQNCLESTAEAPCSTRLSFMQSDGGLTPVEFFSGHRAILSGPAGGVVGYSLTTWDPEAPQPVAAFDMGGTSTDVSRYDGHFSHVYETSIAGITIQAPQLDISTVAAGGGSRLFFRSGLFVVGPESAGAHPGPVCYRKGGHLAVTDANLQLGRIIPESFPHIFGPTEDQPLDTAATGAAFAALAEEVNSFYAAEGLPPKSTDEIAYGFLKVANEAMCRPIRALTQMKGYDISTHVLACFGGAGPQHACAIARALGMKRIFISKFSGILSAYGLSLADVVNEGQAPVSLQLFNPKEARERRAAEGGAAAGGAAAASSAPDAAPATAPEAATVEELAVLEAAPCNVQASTVSDIAARLHGLAAEVAGRLLGQGFTPSQLSFELYANLRYEGTDSAIMVPCRKPAAAGSSAPGELLFPMQELLQEGSAAATPAALSAISAAVAGTAQQFVAAYKREFGFVLRERLILADDVRVRGIARIRGDNAGAKEAEAALKALKAGAAAGAGDAAAAQQPSLPSPSMMKQVYFEQGRLETPVYQLTSLTHRHPAVHGPAIIIDRTTTLIVEPDFAASLTPAGDVEVVFLGSTGPAAVSAAGAAAAAAAEASAPASSLTTSSAALAAAAEGVPADPIQLSIFSHRFMGIAEQMGRVLQRTSISVNMRERLDYSCALFGPDGGLVANAPHIPVHLGAMQDAVRFQVQHWGADLKEGDVLVSNHPQLAGGSHLPDITVITPVFNAGRIVFFVASRGHHADIGGIAPGSMPPNSKTLAEEGAAIVAFKLVQGGVFQEEGITELLLKPGTLGIPGCSGSRNLKDCISDLRAQVAANTKGITLVKELIGEYGLQTVHAYMRHIQANAEVAVRQMLVQFSLSRGLPEVGTVRAVDYMDDGTPISLAITIDRRTRSAHFDFTGTGPEVYGNINAPRAVTYSAIIYCLRCLVGQDVPLNQGCLAPVSITIPEGTLLYPSSQAAVVGGNVVTSQRVVDVVLKAFEACAASQGCMGNFSMGTNAAGRAFGFYETIAGGAGAGPTWEGRSGQHSHMTNTRISDPEVLERRYPVVLRTFSLREGSGGKGAHKGGDGVVREMQFRVPLTMSILSERRAFQPYGMAGGEPGARGVNLLFRADGRKVNLGGKATVDVLPGERFRIETPGGGGYGEPGKPAEAAGGAAAAAAASMIGSGDEAKKAAFLFSGSVGKYKETQESV